MKQKLLYRISAIALCFAIEGLTLTSAFAMIPIPPAMPVPIQVPPGLKTSATAPDVLLPNRLSDSQLKFLLYIRLGDACIDSEDWSRAVVFYSEALGLFRLAHGSPAQLSKIAGGLSIAFCGQKEMAMAIKFAQLSVQAANEEIPSDGIDLSIAYNNYAYIRKMMGQYRDAQTMYECALRYAPKLSSQDRFRAALMEANLAEVYLLNRNRLKAIESYRHALQAFRQMLPREHPAIAEMEQRIESLKRSLAESSVRRAK